MDAWQMIISVAYDIKEYHKVNIALMTMWCVWFEFFGGLFNAKPHDIWEGTHYNKGEMWDSNWEHPFP